jgi:hypothetical protein
VFDETDLPERLYLGIRHDLYIDFPNAAFGPGHVVLDDENWDAYADAIERINIVLAVRSLTALGQYVTARHVAKSATRKGWSVDMYDDHSTEEIAATLAVLRLIEWHENGAHGDAPNA